MEISRQFVDQLSYDVIGCAIEVHKELGPGLLESVYQTCLERELFLNEIKFESQIVISVNYKGIQTNAVYRLDLLVENLLVVELKAIDGLIPLHRSQLLTYMQILKKPKGLLINFNCMNIFKEGQITVVNDLYAALPYSSM